MANPLTLLCREALEPSTLTATVTKKTSLLLCYCMPMNVVREEKDPLRGIVGNNMRIPLDSSILKRRGHTVEIPVGMRQYDIRLFLLYLETIIASELRQRLVWQVELVFHLLREL